MKYVIIGAGQAGTQAAAELRQGETSGTIHVIGGEEYVPYQRPPLSGDFLTGALEIEALSLRAKEFYESKEIELVLGDPVVHIDRRGQQVVTRSARTFQYDRLLIATGAPPRQIPLAGVDCGGVFYLRTINDALKLRSHLAGRRHTVILGGGYIGMEVASVVKQLGRAVTVVERSDRILHRVSSPIISDYLERLHAQAGVEIRSNSSIREIMHENGVVNGVILTDDTRIPCDTLVLAGGASPETSLADRAGLAVSNGIVVNAQAQTSDENILAVGDCANFPSARYGRRLRLESVPHAIDHAKIAAANMAGQNLSYDPIPWFWSEQYEARLQIVGLTGYADQLVLRGNPEEGKFSVWHLENNSVLAVECMNQSGVFAVAKKIIRSGALVEPEKLSDLAIDLKRVLD